MTDPSTQLLVTTSHSLLLVDVANGRHEVIHRGQGLYFGTSCHHGHLFVAARNRLVSSAVPRSEERGEILVFDADLRLVDRLHAPFPLRDLHSIEWHDDRLFMTCSFDNMIAIFDKGVWTRWFPFGETQDENSDRNHFNSFLFEGAHALLLAHNWGGSEAVSFCPNRLEVTGKIQLGNCAHDLWREDGQLFTCSSAEGKIIGDRGFEIEVGGFPRGVARRGGRRYVGISELAERDQRDFTTGLIKVFDTDWKFERLLTLPGEGLVLDIMPWPA